MSQGTLKAEKEWVSASAAAGIIGISPKAIRDLVERGLISVRRIPGRLATFSRADCARIATESVEPATATVASAK